MAHWRIKEQKELGGTFFYIQKRHLGFLWISDHDYIFTSLPDAERVVRWKREVNETPPKYHTISDG